MEYLFGTRSGGWQDQDKERAAQLEEERKKAKKEKAKALQEAAKNQPQDPQNLPLPVLNPQVNIPTPPRDESSETSGDPESSQSHHKKYHSFPKLHEQKNGSEILHQHAKTFQTSYCTCLKVTEHFLCTGEGLIST